MNSENINPYFAKDNKKLSQVEIKEKIWNHIDLLGSREYCRNFDRVDYNTKCQCVRTHFSGIDRDVEKRSSLFKLLEQYESNREAPRQIILHVIITTGFIRRYTLTRGTYSRPNFLLPGVKGVDGNGEREDILVCVNGLRWLFYIGGKKWHRLEKEAALPNPNERKKILMTGNKINHCRCEDEV